MIFRRSNRSTKTPANNPINRLGAAVAISIKPTLMAELVRRKTRMEAAREVKAEPMVETSCAVHIMEKLRLRKTANGDNLRTAAGAIVIVQLLGLSQPVP